MDTKSLWDGVAGVGFDAVGTLIEPAPAVTEAYRAAAARQGVDLDPAEVRARFRRHFNADEAGEALATDEAREARRWRAIVGGVLPEVGDPDRAFTELWRHFARPDSWRCFPDVGPALRSLAAAGLRLAVASNFDARLRGVVAGLPDLSGASPALVISSAVGRRKPHPDFYRAVCGALDLPPDRVLFVGDDPENDVFGPARAGLRSVLLDRRPAPAGGSWPGDLLTLVAARAG